MITTHYHSFHDKMLISSLCLAFFSYIHREMLVYWVKFWSRHVHSWLASHHIRSRSSAVGLLTPTLMDESSSVSSADSSISASPSLVMISRHDSLSRPLPRRSVSFSSVRIRQYPVLGYVDYNTVKKQESSVLTRLVTLDWKHLSEYICSVDQWEYIRGHIRSGTSRPTVKSLPSLEGTVDAPNSADTKAKKNGQGLGQKKTKKQRKGRSRSLRDIRQMLVDKSTNALRERPRFMNITRRRRTGPPATTAPTTRK